MVVAGRNWAAIASAASMRASSVALELWSGEPPLDDEAWERRREARLLMEPGTLRVVSLMGDRTGAAVSIKAAGAYGLRVYVRGQGAVIDAIDSLLATEELPEPASWPRGVEQFLAQVWMTAS